MASAYFRILNHELLTKYSDIVPEEAPLIILDSKYAVCMADNGKDNKHKNNIARKVHFVINGEKIKMHNIDWCEGGLKLSIIAAKHFGENGLNTMMKYIMVRLDN